jgi:hypothetical protein
MASPTANRPDFFDLTDLGIDTQSDHATTVSLGGPAPKRYLLSKKNSVGLSSKVCTLALDELRRLSRNKTAILLRFSVITSQIRHELASFDPHGRAQQYG